MKADLIDRIYECSFVPELWPGVLDEVAQVAESSGGLLFAVRDKVLTRACSRHPQTAVAAVLADRTGGCLRDCFPCLRIAHAWLPTCASEVSRYPLP